MMKLLLYFHEHDNQTVSRQQLIEQVWQNTYASDETINRGVSRLRKILGGKQHHLIKTIPKKGYLFQLPSDLELVFIDNNQECEADHNAAIAKEAIQVSAPLQHSKQPLKITGLVLSILIMIVIGFGFEWQKQKAADTIHTTANLTALHIQPIAAPKDDKFYAQSLHNHLITKLALVKELTLFNGQSQNRVHSQSFFEKQFQLETTLRHHGEQLHVAINIRNLNNQVSHAANLNFDHDEINIDAISAEVAAFVRLTLIHKRLAAPYLSAFNPLNYLEVEQLVLARQYATVESTNSLSYAYSVIKKLNQKYPNSSQVLGLLAHLNFKRSNFAQVNVVTEKRNELNNIYRTLAIDPSNFDALKAVFSYNADFAHLRHKSAANLNALLLYHPDKALTWRNQLRLMIYARMSCDKIGSFVSSIPKGMFNPTRLKVINQILDTCINQQSPEIVLSQLSFIPTDKTDRILYRNIVNFNLRYDNMGVYRHKTSLLYTGPKEDTYRIKYQLMSQDHLNANSTLERLKRNGNGYWLWLSQLFLRLHPLPQLDANAIVQQDLWQEGFYPLLVGDAELYLGAVLSKDLHSSPPQAKAALSRIKDYLSKRPSFVINITNRRESIAKIMLQYHGGQTQASQATANRLFVQLNQNYLEDPKSFLFWNLGRFHLIAKQYCGKPCDDGSDTATEYLAQYFSQHHLWWLDDFELMEQTLSPWAKGALTQQYLDKVAKDRIRMQRKLGLKNS